MSQEFSMDETEAIIANFQNGESLLANYLVDLSDVSKIKLPSIPPSISGNDSNVIGLRSARKGMTIFLIEAAIIAAAATSAAALSGIGPEPVVKFVRNTANVVTSTVEKVASFVTGENAKSQEPAPETTLPVADPSPSTSESPTSVADPTPIPSSTPAPAVTVSPTPTKSTSPTPTTKADPKPTGFGVPSPSKGASNDDHENGETENKSENKSENELEKENSVSTPAPTIKSTAIASPKASSTKSSENNEKSAEKTAAPISSPKATATKKSESSEKKKVESVKSPSSNNDDD